MQELARIAFVADPLAASRGRGARQLRHLRRPRGDAGRDRRARARPPPRGARGLDRLRAAARVRRGRRGLGAPVRGSRSPRTLSRPTRTWQRSERGWRRSPSTGPRAASRSVTPRSRTAESATFLRRLRLGLTTIALPPPRRTGSAAASRRPPPRNSIPVAAPISGVELNTCPRARSAVASAVARNAGSACVVAVFRWVSRGSAIA